MGINVKHKKLFKEWLLAEILFLILIMLISSCVFFYTNNHIRKQFNELYMANLSSTQTEIDSIIQTVVSRINEYSRSPNIIALTNGYKLYEERNLIQVIDNIKQTNASIPGIQEIVIFINNSEVYLTSAGIMNIEVFDEIYNCSQEDFKSFRNIISSEYDLEKMIPIKFERNCDGYFTGMYMQDINKKARIAVVLCRNQIIEGMNRNLQNKENTFVVFNKRNEILFTSNNLVSRNLEMSKDLLSSKIPKKIKIEDEDYFSLIKQSPNQDLIYMLLIHDEDYLVQYINIQRISILVLLATILLGVFVSYYMTKRRYMPIQKVLNYSRRITPSDILLSSDNELEQIKETIEIVYNQSKNSEGILSSHNEHIKENVLKMVIDGNVD